MREAHARHTILHDSTVSSLVISELLTELVSARSFDPGAPSPLPGTACGVTRSSPGRVTPADAGRAPIDYKE